MEGGQADDCPGPGLPHHVPEGLQRVAARVLRHDELPVAPAIELSDDSSRMFPQAPPVARHPARVDVVGVGHGGLQLHPGQVGRHVVQAGGNGKINLDCVYLQFFIHDVIFHDMQ